MKKLFKVIAVVMMTMMAVLMSGCESQQEKFDKAYKKFADYNQNQVNQVYQVVNAKDGKKAEKLAAILKECKQKNKEFLNELEDIAKGDKKLEQKVALEKASWEKDDTEVYKLIAKLNKKEKLDEVKKKCSDYNKDQLNKMNIARSEKNTKQVMEILEETIQKNKELLKEMEDIAKGDKEFEQIVALEKMTLEKQYAEFKELEAKVDKKGKLDEVEKKCSDYNKDQLKKMSIARDENNTKKVFEIYEEIVQKNKEFLKEMENIAKGDKDLEKKVALKKWSLEKDYAEFKELEAKVDVKGKLDEVEKRYSDFNKDQVKKMSIAQNENNTEKIIAVLEESMQKNKEFLKEMEDVAKGDKDLEKKVAVKKWALEKDNTEIRELIEKLKGKEVSK